MANILQSIRGRLLGLSHAGTLQAENGYANAVQTVTSTATTLNAYGTSVIASTGLNQTHVLGTPDNGGVGTFKNVVIQSVGTTSTGCVIATESTAILYQNAATSTGLTITTTSTAGMFSVLLQYVSTGKWLIAGGSTSLNVA